MSEKHSIANRKKWEKIPKKERSEKMSKLASIKHSRMTKKQRHDHAMVMLKGRNL